MKRAMVSFLVICLLILCFTACGSNEKDQRGIGIAGTDHEYYIIKLPDGKKVADYFELTGAEGVVTGMQTDVKSYSEKLDTIYNRQTKDGAWVAYAKSQTGLMIYMPKGFPENLVAITCAHLATNWEMSDGDYMTIEEAKAYIPSLAK